MRNAGLEEAQLESRLLGEISITSDMQMTSPLWQGWMSYIWNQDCWEKCQLFQIYEGYHSNAESKEKRKHLLMSMNVENEKD